MTEPTTRTPYCTKIRYGISGAPILTEDEMDGTFAPGVGVEPTLIELVYHAPRDDKPASVSASVTGDWTRYGERDGGQVETHFRNGPDGWPAWLAEEARRHDPDAVSAVPGPATDQAAPAVWIDGHPQLEAIAAAVWDRCRTEGTSLVVDDPRNIAVAAYTAAFEATVSSKAAPKADSKGATDQAALRDRIRRVLARIDGFDFDSLEPHDYQIQATAILAELPAPADRAAVLDRIREVVRRLAAHAVGFQDALDESDRGPWGKTVAADIAELRSVVDEDAPLSPFYEHPECGFHWHGRDGMDIPVRDGQPVCPRCELAAAEKRLRHLEKRCEELRTESKRRGKIKLEQAEQIRHLEKKLDEVRIQLGAEILRAGQAESELRRVAAESAPADTGHDNSETPFTTQVWPLNRVLTEVRCGSKDWTWDEEWADLDHRHAQSGYLDKLAQDIRANGITMPVLIGTDGRLWDGHHRLRIAVLLGIGYVPVEVPAAERPAVGQQPKEA